MTQFPYGNDLSKVSEWIGRWETPSNSWYVQYLGGAASLNDCEFHFLLHGMDNLVSAHCVLTGIGLGLPIGPKGFVSIPKTAKDIRDLVGGEVREDIDQAWSNSQLEGKLNQPIIPNADKPFQDRLAQSNIWETCFNLEEEKQYMHRTTATPFSLADLSEASCDVEVVSGSFVIIQWDKLSFSFPGDSNDSFPPIEMGSASAGFSMPGHTAGKYNCKWQVREWHNNFYNRCPFRKGGDNNIFTTNRFLLYLPPYTGYLFWTFEDYLEVFPDKSYPFWQGIFPQLNQSMEHFMDNEWAGSVGGWAGDLPQSYISEFAP
ncbi:hypothetical protein [Tritonibacter sp. SIMBA_163]|uniref:hypothetical protein n=1 Tax=Tritonibacter sp. SIMBA_163 TaxID=3080868 RepID=UPI00397F596B